MLSQIVAKLAGNATRECLDLALERCLVGKAGQEVLSVQTIQLCQSGYHARQEGVSIFGGIDPERRKLCRHGYRALVRVKVYVILIVP